MFFVPKLLLLDDRLILMEMLHNNKYELTNLEIETHLIRPMNRNEYLLHFE